MCTVDDECSADITTESCSPNVKCNTQEWQTRSKLYITINNTQVIYCLKKLISVWGEIYIFITNLSLCQLNMLKGMETVQKYKINFAQTFKIC